MTDNNRKLYLRSNNGVVNGGVDTDITFAITPPLTTSDFFNFTLTLESAEIPISHSFIVGITTGSRLQLQSL